METLLIAGYIVGVVACVIIGLWFAIRLRMLDDFADCMGVFFFGAFISLPWPGYAVLGAVFGGPAAILWLLNKWYRKHHP